MKLKNELLYNQYFNKGLEKLATIDLKISDLVKLNKLIEKLPVEHKQIDKVKESLLKKYAIVKDDGNFDIENNQIKFKTEKDQETCLKKINELMTTEFDVDFDKIKLSDDVKLSYLEYQAIKDLIEV